MALSKNLDKLQAIVQCAICFEVFTDPVTLKCFHSFCVKCIKGWKTKEQDGKDVYSCPVCRSCTEKDGLKPVFVMNDLLELYWLVKGENQSCSKCKKQPPKWRCSQCKSNCCPDCKQDHDFFPALRHHKWVSFDDKEALLSIEKVVYCEKHPDKVLELECQQCDELICYLCKAVNHEGHQTGTIDQALQRLIPIIQEKQEQIKENITSTTDTIANIKNEIKDTEKWYEKVQRRLNQQKLDAIEKVQSDHAGLMRKVNALKSKEVSQYTSAMEQLENTVKEEQSLIQWTDNILATTSGTSLLQELKTGLQENLATKAAITRKVIVKKPAHPAYHVFNVNKTDLMGHIDSVKDETKVDIQTIAKDIKPVEAFELSGKVDGAPVPNEEKPQEVCSSLADITQTENELQIDEDKNKSSSDSDSQISNAASEPSEQSGPEAGSQNLFLNKQLCNFGITKLFPFQMKTLSDKTLVPDKKTALPFVSSSCAILGDHLCFSEFNTNVLHIYTLSGTSIRQIQLPQHIRCRALAVFGTQLVLASRQGLYLTNKTRSSVTIIDSSAFVDVATHGDLVYGLNAGLGVVSRFQDNQKKWEKLMDIELKDFESMFEDTTCSFHLQVCIDCIFVSSWKSRIIQKYDSRGKPLKTYSAAFTAKLIFPAVCGADKSGDLLVADRRLGLLILGKDGNWQSFTSTVVSNAQFAVAIDPKTMCVLTRTVSGAGNAAVHTCHLERFLIK